MIILDTDILTLAMRSSPSAQTLLTRIHALPLDEVTTTIISFEEQVRGWMSRIARSRSVAEQVEFYQRLHQLLENYSRLHILDFDTAAAAEYQRLRQTRLKIGTMDLKIAAIALAREATLVTRNLGDFARIPGLVAEDWTTGPGPAA